MKFISKVWLNSSSSEEWVRFACKIELNLFCLAEKDLFALLSPQQHFDKIYFF